MITLTNAGARSTLDILGSDAPMDAGLSPSFQSPWMTMQADAEKAQRERRASQLEKLDAALLDPESFFKKNPFEPQFTTDADKAKRRVLVSAALRVENGGKPLPMGADGHELMRRRVAATRFQGRGAEDDDAFHAELVKDATRRKDGKELGRELAKSAFNDAMMPATSAGGFKAFREAVKRHAGYDPTREADYWEQWTATRLAAAETIAEFKPALDAVWNAFETEGDVGKAARDAYSAIPDHADRMRFMTALRLRAEKLAPEAQPRFWSNVGKQSERDITAFGRDALAYGQTNTAMFDDLRKSMNDPLYMPGPQDIATRERLQGEDAATRREIDFIADVRAVQESTFDPVKHLAPDGSWTQAFERGAYGIPGAAVTSLAAAVPGVGMATFYASSRESIYQQYRRDFEASGMDYETASKNADAIAPVAALPQVLMEKLQLKAFAGKLPMLENVMQKAAGKFTSRTGQFAMRAGVGAIEEGILEKAQDLVPAFVQDVAHGLQADIPDVNWSDGKNGVLDGFWKDSAALVVTMLPLAIFGAGHGVVRDQQRITAVQAASDKELLALGATPADISSVRMAGNFAEQAQAVETMVGNLDPQGETAKAATDELKAQQASQARAAADLERLGYATPRFIQTADGISVVDSVTGEEIGQAPDLSGAIRIARTHTVAMDDMEADQVAALGSLMEAARAAAELDPNAAVDVGFDETFDPEKASPEMAARFAPQVALKEQAEGGTGDIARSVLGTSETTFAQGLRTTVNRIFRGGSVLTVFHETFHGLRRKAHAARTITRADEIALLRGLDQVLATRKTKDGTSLRFIPEGMADDQISDTLLDEAISEIAEMEVLRTRKGAGKGKLGVSRGVVSRNLSALARLIPGVAGKFSAFLRAVRAHWGLSLSRAVAIKAAERRGEFDAAGYDAFLNKLLGLDEQQAHDDGVRAGLNRILNLPEFDPTDDISFSIGREDVNQSGSLARLRGKNAIKFSNPIETPLGKVIGYEWQSKLIESDSGGPEGMVLKRVSDWDKATTNAETGRDIVHHFTIEKGDGEISTVSLESTLKSAGTSAKDLKSLITAARRLPLREAEMQQLTADIAEYRKRYDAEERRVSSLNAPEPSWQESEWQSVRDRGQANMMVGDVFVSVEDQSKPFPRDRVEYGRSQWKQRQMQIGMETPDFGRVDALKRMIRKDREKLKSSGVTEENGTPVDLRQGQSSFSIGRATVTPSAETRTFQGAEGSPSVIGPASFAIGAWHGTPHKVDRFSLDKIGTGEGAQAYGWGLYFANALDVAKSYMENTESRAKVQYTEVLRYDGARVDALDWPSVKKRAASAIRSMGKDRAIQTATDRNATEFLTAIEALDESKISSGLERFGAPTGNLYRVELDVEDSDLLDWDKPLSEQSEKVRDALVNFSIPADWKGIDIYHDLDGQKLTIDDLLGDSGGAKERSQILHSSGISGIRYLDGNSRNNQFSVRGAGDYHSVINSSNGQKTAEFEGPDSYEKAVAKAEELNGQGSYNYVIFDESKIKITEENGTPVDMGSGGFSIGPADVPAIMEKNALSRIQDPRRRTQAMQRIARDFNSMRLQIDRLLALSGRKRSKAELRQEANAREDLRAEELIADVHRRFGSILHDEDLTKIKSQPVHAWLADPNTPLRGRLMSKAAAIKAHPERYQLHRGGEYDGSEGVSRSVFGGQNMPDQMAQELFDHGLISEPTPDAMWEALAAEQNTVARNKEFQAKAMEQIREAKAEAKREATEWLNTQGKDQETTFNPREEILRSLRMLDAILLAMPPEVRGKVGGYTQMARITTDEAKLSFLKDKLAKADKELEIFLRAEFGKEFEDLMKRARPSKDAPGERPSGNIDPDAWEIFKIADAATHWKFVDAEAEATKYDTKADHEDTTPEDSVKFRAIAQVIRLVQNWEGADAARREMAVKELEGIFYGGLDKLRRTISARMERVGILRNSAQTGTAKAGHRMEIKDAKKQSGKLAWEIMSFGQVVNVLFGEDSTAARWFNSREIAASNALEDSMQVKVNALESLFETLAGSRFAGEKLRHRMQSEESITVTDALGVKQTFTESEAITFLLMWRQEDGARHMRGMTDEQGNVVSSWAWDESSAADVEQQLSPAGQQMLAFLGDSYGEEYDRINDVFRRIWHVSMPRHKMYAPLTVKATQAKADTILDPVSGDTMGVGMTPGSLKNRSQTAVAEPDFRDAFQVYLTHARQMEHFIAYGEFARDAMAIVNRRDTRNAIEAAGGSIAMNTLGRWLDFFAMGGIRDANMGSEWMQTAGRMLGRLSQAALVGRVSVLAMQSLQLAAATYKMPLGAFLSRFVKLQTGRLSWGDAIRSPYIQRRLAEMPPVVRDLIKGMEAGTPNRLKFLAAKGGRTIAGADALFTAGTYAIFYDYHLKQNGGDAAAAHAEAERLTDQVAQPTRSGARSMIELANSGNPAFRALWNFSSDPRQKASIIVYEMMRRDKKGGEKAAAAGKAIAITWGVSGILQAVLRAVLRDLRSDEDDEIFDERHWNLKRLALQAATGPLGAMPFFGEMIEGASYKATGTFMPGGSLLDSLGDAVGLVPKWMKGNFDLLEDAEKLFTGGAVFSGTSAASASGMHVLRDAWNFIDNLTD